MSNDTDTLIRAAKLAYGDAWTHPLAKALGVNPRTMERVGQAHRHLGEYDRPIPPGWMVTLAEVLDARHTELTRASAELRSRANERLTVPTDAHSSALAPAAAAHPPLRTAHEGGRPMDRATPRD